MNNTKKIKPIKAWCEAIPDPQATKRGVINLLQTNKK